VTLAPSTSTTAKQTAAKTAALAKMASTRSLAPACQLGLGRPVPTISMSAKQTTTLDPVMRQRPSDVRTLTAAINACARADSWAISATALTSACRIRVPMEALAKSTPAMPPRTFASASKVFRARHALQISTIAPRPVVQMVELAMMVSTQSLAPARKAGKAPPARRM